MEESTHARTQNTRARARKHAPFLPLFLSRVGETVNCLHCQGCETRLVPVTGKVLPSPASHSRLPTGFRQQMARGALRPPATSSGLNSWLPTPPALEWDTLGVICGRAAKNLNLLFGTWISFPRGTGGERGKGEGGSVSQVWGADLVQLWQPDRSFLQGPAQRGI